MNCFSFCIGKDYLTEKFEEFIDEQLDEQLDEEKSIEDNKKENIIVLVKFKKDGLENYIEFLISEDGENFSFIPSKLIEEIKMTWFENDKPKHILFKKLSKLSENRKVFHNPEYFVNRIKKVYFRYENKQFVPYRYSVLIQK